MPIIPGLTDREEDLDAVARGARDAKAQWFGGNALFLMPSSLKEFLPFLEQKFPQLLRRYQEWYGRGGYAPETYRKEITERVRKLRAKYGLGSLAEIRTPRQEYSPQLALGLAAAEEAAT